MPPSSDDALDFVVRRDDWSRTLFVDGPPPGDLADGQVRFRVDRFAFTANNISYAMAGDMLRYWDFFPAEEGWGRIPTMGFGDVVASTHPDVAVGQRCFGFYPMSRYLVIEPSSASGNDIVDGVAHRQGIAPIYAQYTRTEGDPLYTAESEDLLLLLRGLFMTSFLVDDYLRDNAFFGAGSVIVGSASSKTGIALAHRLSTEGGARAIGLTSARNAAFVKGLGLYDEVMLYDDVEALPVEPTAFVDMAGNGPVTNRLHRHLGDSLVLSCQVGGTHWDAGGRDAELPGATPEFFFAPGQAQKRAADWGPGGFQKRIGGAWAGFRDSARGWLSVERAAGRDAVERVYRETLEGRTDPSRGHVLSLWED